MLATISPLTDGIGFSVAYLCVLGVIVLLTLHVMRRVRHPAWMLSVGLVLLLLTYCYTWLQASQLVVHGYGDTRYYGQVFKLVRIFGLVTLAGLLLVRGLFIIRACRLKD